MSPVLLILTYIPTLLTLDITTNEGQKPRLRIGLGNEIERDINNIDNEAHERYTQRKSGLVKRGNTKLQALLDQREILRGGHEINDGLTILQAIVDDHVINKRGRDNHRHDSNEERDDNRFEDNKTNIVKFTQRNSSRLEETDNTKLQALLDQKAIMRAGLEINDGLTIPQAIVDDHVIDKQGRENQRYDNKYKIRNDSRIDDDDDSTTEDENDSTVEEDKDDRTVEEGDQSTIEDSDDSRIQGGLSIESVRNKDINKLVAIMLLDEFLNIYYSSEISQSDLSSIKYGSDQNKTKLYEDLEYYLRSRIWRTCTRKAANVCKKACVDAIKFGCRSSCKSKIKKYMKKDCKPACKDRFGVL